MFGDLEHGYKCSSCKLESIAEVGSSRRVFKDELLSEGVPFYRGTEVAELSAEGSIKPNLFISKEHYERLIGSTGKPEIGDLLLPSICPGGQIWCVNTNAPFYFKDGRVLWIRPDRDAVDGVYLRHALSTMFQMSFSNIASGTTFAELKIFLLKELNVPLPELKDQKEFVSFASQVDKSGFSLFPLLLSARWFPELTSGSHLVPFQEKSFDATRRNGRASVPLGVKQRLGRN